MKKIYILSLSVLMLAAVGCQKVSDWMEKQETFDLQFEDIWTDENYVEGFLNNNLASIPGQGWIFGGEPLWALTDEGWSSLDAAGGTSHRVYDGNFSSTSGWPGTRGLYGSLPYRIRNINQFLHYIVLPETPVKNEDSRRRMIADAYVIRAYYMFELFKEYGPLYLYNEDGVDPEDGHPEYLRYITELTDSYVNLRRVPAEDYIRWIIADCDRGLAIDDLPWRATTGNQATRMTKSVAWCIKATALMWLASPLFNDGKDYWEEAYQMNKEALKLLRDHGYELFTTCTNTQVYGTGDGNAYREYNCNTSLAWAAPTATDKETILAIGGASGSYANNWVGSRHTDIGNCGTCPTQEQVDCYDTRDGVPVLDLANPYADQYHTKPNFNPENTMYDEQHPYENRDPRFEECIMHHGSPYVWDKAYTLDISAGGINFRSTLPTDNTQTRTGYYYCKTIPPNCTLNGKQTGRGPKQYKLSEMILNFAECALNADHLEEAMEAVNEIRARVHMPPLPEELALNKEKLRLRVYNERRVELAFEEARYYDLRRRCKPEEEIPGIKYFSAMDVTYAGDWSAATYTRVPLREAERHGYEPQCKLSPLPKGEVSNIKVITGIDFQNYGWD